MLLSEARTRVSQKLDDIDSNGSTERYSTSEIDIALGVALEDMMFHYSSNGGTQFSKQEEFSIDSNGNVDLGSANPLNILSVGVKLGNNFYVDAKPLMLKHAQQGINLASGTVIVSYNYIPTFPAASSDAFIYGSSGNPSSKLADELIVLLAANNLAIKDNEVNALLEQRIADYRLSLIKQPDIPDHATFSPLRTSLRGYPYRNYFYGWSPSGQKLTMRLA